MSQARPVVTPRPMRASASRCLRHRARLLSMCMRIVRDPHTAEDIVQETMTRAIANGIGFGRRADPWFATVARRLCIDHLRGSRRAAGGMDAAEFEDPGASDAIERVHDALDQTQRRALYHALHGLRERQRRILWLHEVEGWEYADIAALEGVSEAALRNAACRARRVLRAKLVTTFGKALGVPAAVAHWLRSLRRVSEHVRPTSAPHVLAVGVTLTIVLGSLALVKPPPPVETRSRPVDVVRSQRPDQAPQPFVEAALALRQRVQNDASSGTPGSSDLIVANTDTKHRRHGTMVPQRTYVSVEVRGPAGNVVYRMRTTHECEREGEGLMDKDDSWAVRIGC